MYGGGLTGRAAGDRMATVLTKPADRFLENWTCYDAFRAWYVAYEMRLILLFGKTAIVADLAELCGAGAGTRAMHSGC